MRQLSWSDVQARKSARKRIGIGCQPHLDFRDGDDSAFLRHTCDEVVLEPVVELERQGRYRNATPSEIQLMGQ